MAVSAKIEVVIKDACILFDLIDLDLLGCFYQLNLNVLTTPDVIAEITDENQRLQVNLYIDNGQLQIDESGDLADQREIVDKNPGLSLADASVLDLATRRKATVLSSDKSLRKESQRRGLTVRGVLWIVEELHLQQILSLEVMLEKLKAYPEINRWAPKSHIETLIKKYSPEPKP
jgi:rRNA maturation endonuclease Nob1